MIYADGMHGRFRLGYGAQFIHVAAALAEDRREIDHLVAGGAAPNARDAGGCTPLHYAAWNNPVGEVAAALVEAGADPEACDGYGEKPINYAVNAVNAAFIEAALDAGADPAGNGATFRDAEAKVRLTCPTSAETPAYRRLLRARLRPVSRLPSASTRGRTTTDRGAGQSFSARPLRRERFGLGILSPGQRMSA